MIVSESIPLQTKKCFHLYLNLKAYTNFLIKKLWQNGTFIDSILPHKGTSIFYYLNFSFLQNSLAIVLRAP